MRRRGRIGDNRRPGRALSAEDHDAFWLWAGVAPQPALAADSYGRPGMWISRPGLDPRQDPARWLPEGAPGGDGAHLEAAALCVEPLDPRLRQSLEDALAHWLSVEVDGPASAAAAVVMYEWCRRWA